MINESRMSLGSLSVCLVISLTILLGIGPETIAAPEPPGGDIAKVARGNNAFALDLYRRLAPAGGDIVFSPYSIQAALAMTWAGARGQTEKEMAETLRFGLAQDEFHPAMGALIGDLNERGSGGKYELAVANRLWAQTGMEILDAFREIAEQSYGAGVEQTDFASAPEKARKAINDWCEKMTRGKIKAPLPKGVIRPDTRLVLANAIYFKGKWESRFEKKDTRDRPFHLAGGEEIEAPTMWQREDFDYGKFEGLSVLSMDYEGGDLSLVALLPDDRDGLAALEDKLTMENLETWLGGLGKKEVDVFFPRFKMDYGLELRDMLSKMGMPGAFAGAADFSGMTGKTDLFISSVIHKAMIELNEEGTEAAAVTVVTMSRESVPRRTYFRADHPFIYMIRDKKTGCILFMGRVTDPR